MRSLLFVDMLGVKSRWHQDGRVGAEAAFSEFEGLVVQVVKDHAAGDVLAGTIESDAAALVCSSQHVAVTIGKELFRQAFSIVTSGNHKRPWLRGAILPYSGGLSLRVQRKTAVGNISASVYEGSLLDAIAVEKAGFKGMRLLVASVLVNDSLRGAHSLMLDNGKLLHSFKRTTHGGYPGRLNDGYEDLFWMATADPDEWKSLRWTMARRLRWAAKDPDEFMQAAATQVLFHEYTAILGSLQDESVNPV